MSVILRTAGIDRSAEELAWDLENLLTVWTAILNVVLERPSPFLIYRESDSVVRALRDYLTNEIGEILIDDKQTYEDAIEHVEATMPHNLKKVKLYEDPVPLFTRYQIESQIESAFAHTVHLPSGGSIVIDHTEALVSIDINSARATKGGDIEATALHTNLEAAEEIARQLRIRDLGGLIVIDFIDMGPSKHQRDVENRLRDSVRQDRARVQIGKISRFGLLEMSRQRLRPSIGESSHMTCPRCSGFGTIRSVESLALAILRIVGEEARKERTAKVIAQLPVEVSTYLLNEKRDWVQNLEDSNDTQIVLVANHLLETPHYEVRRVRDDQTELPENTGVSYLLTDSAAEPEAPQAILERKAIEAPVVGTLKPSKPAPKREEPKQEKPKSEGLLTKIVALFTGGDSDEEKDRKSQPRRKTSGQQSRGRRSQQSKRGDSRRSADGRSPQRKKTQKKAASKKSQAKKTDARRKPAQKDAQARQQPQDNKAADAQDDSTTETKRPTRKRRSRGGRRRRRSSADRPEQSSDTQQQSNEATARQPAKDQQPPQDQKPQQDNKPATKPEPAQQTQPATDQAPSTPKKPAADKKAPVATEEQQPKAESKPKPRPRRKKKPTDDAAAAPQDAEPKSTRPRKPAADKAASAEKPEPKPAKREKPAAEQAPAAEKPESKPVKTSKPAAESSAAKPSLLPWEPPQLPVAKADTPKAAPKPEPKPEPVQAAPAPKAEPKPAEPGAD